MKPFLPVLQFFPVHNGAEQVFELSQVIDWVH